MFGTARKLEKRINELEEKVAFHRKVVVTLTDIVDRQQGILNRIGEYLQQTEVEEENGPVESK